MEHSSEYPGPSPDDYANVLALNTAFIKATSDLKGPQRGRLAAAPFLLFSLHENDTDWWANALADQRQGELMEAELSDPQLRRIQTAAMGFLWQLGRRNPYAARLVSGATITWCDQITALPLVTLLERIGRRDDLIRSQLLEAGPIGERLLGGGISSRPQIRRSSHLFVLHCLLTRARVDNLVRLPAAACSLSGPMRVAPNKL